MARGMSGSRTSRTPTLQEATDLIARIPTSAICGSDLHPFHGRLPPDDPFSIGHEFVGVVEEAGKEVRAVKRGDRVVAPFSVSCGFCYFCRNRLPAQCETTNHAVFGMGRRGGGRAGAQAVDYVPYRLERSKALGCVPVDASAADPVEQIRALTHGRGADVTLEAVGHEAAPPMG